MDECWDKEYDFKCYPIPELNIQEYGEQLGGHCNNVLSQQAACGQILDAANFYFQLWADTDYQLVKARRRFRKMRRRCR